MPVSPDAPVAAEIVDHRSALAYLFGRINYERADRLPERWRGLNLDRMRDLAARLGDPHRRFRIIHVGGTKGKGSTSAMIAAALTAAGYRTGLYTSPHVVCVEERIQIDGRWCSDDEFTELIRRVRREVDAMDREYAARNGIAGPTYFEITTAAALLYFAQRQAEFVVLEVGLGGRLDSTNICQPEVAVITSISFDHTRQLGNTLAAIAYEKAGIIKPGAPVVTGVTQAEPLDVIRCAAERHRCEFVLAGRDFHHRYRGSHVWPLDADWGVAGLHAGDPESTNHDRGGWRGTDGDGSGFPGTGLCQTRPDEANLHGWAELDYWETIAGQRRELTGLRLGLLGEHQTANAAVALAALSCLRGRGWEIPEDRVREALAGVQIPARTELMGRHPCVMVDAAHNAASIHALIKVLRETCPREPWTRRILVFAASQDKDAAAMLRQLLPEFDVVILSRFVDNPRSADPADLLQTARRLLSDNGASRCQLICEDTPRAAWERAHGLASPRDTICIAGSFFLAAELRGVVRQNAICATKASRSEADVAPPARPTPSEA